MPPYPIKESFQWMTPEFKVASSAGKNTIRIKGVAMKSDAVSRNNRHYIDEELVKAARTFVEKPVTINHDMNKKVGTVKWMEYENGAMEYLADINKQPYVDLLRNKSADIKGVSIEAIYLHNQCPKCGEKFYSETDFQHHMEDVHFIKNFETKQPHGILGQALSLVLTPEEPGYTGTTIELMEKYEKPVSQLLETVIKTAKEKETMKTAEKKGVPYKIREQDETPQEPEKDEHGCGPDEEWDGTKCVPKKTEEPTATEQTAQPNTGTQSEGEPEKLACPEGFHLVTDDQGNQTCEPDLPPPPIDNTTATETDANPVQPAVSTQVAPQAEDGVVVAVTDTPPPCPTGQHRDPETGLCVADDSVVEPPPNPTTVTMETIKLPTKLPRLDEACNWKAKGFSSGESCVTKMQGKVDDPEAFCYAEATETAAHETLNIYEAQTGLRKELNSTTAKQRGTNTKFTEAINTLTEAAASQHKQSVNVLNHVNAIAEKTLSDTKKLIRNVEAAANHNLLAETKKLQASTSSLQNQIKEAKEATTKIYNQLQEYLTAQISKLATSTAKELQTLRKTNPQTINEIQQLRNEIEETKQLATEQKKEFEIILAAADKNNTTLKEKVKTLEEWKAEKEQQITETQKKEDDKKTQQQIIKEALEPMATQISNLEAKLHGSFKQTHKTPQTDEESAEASDQLPYDQK